jgi:hypothetical protein
MVRIISLSAKGSREAPLFSRRKYLKFDWILQFCGAFVKLMEYAGAWLQVAGIKVLPTWSGLPASNPPDPLRENDMPLEKKNPDLTASIFDHLGRLIFAGPRKIMSQYTENGVRSLQPLVTFSPCGKSNFCR